MKTERVKLSTLFHALQTRMQLRILAGSNALDRIIFSHQMIDERLIAGPINLIHPPLIPLLGPVEKKYMLDLSEHEKQSFLNQLLATRPLAILITTGQSACSALKKAAEQAQIPLLSTPLNDYQSLDNLFYCTSRFLSHTLSLPGVFIDVLGVGVLLTGHSSIGKSELALELISRGHALIADDVVRICRLAPDILSGSCPDLLKEFLEIRGLGVLNIRAMFGEGAVKDRKYLQLIIELKRMSSDEVAQMKRLTSTDDHQTILGVNIPKVTIPVTPGRNLAILVETAVRRYLLQIRGYNATEHFIQKQHNALSS